MINKQHVGLYTDQYELTMAQGYYLNGRASTPASFDYFFRKLPFGGGYVVFAGLTDLLQYLESFRYDQEDLEYLRSIGFHNDFLSFLKDFRFRGNLYAPHEGEVIFPNEPVLRVEGNIIETQLIETLVLNLLNFESLIATKASRIRQVAGPDRSFIDFGLRRAQGLGGIHASKAAIIGGANSTSNVYSACLFGLQPSGTQAHSWIQSYDDELHAFRSFAEAYPENCILLVDTYNTLRSGLPNAITVAREMETRDKQLYGVRLDSGDLAYLSKMARKMLDDAGLHYVKIMASNQLDEYVINSLLEQGAPIDGFGVGTSLVTGQKDAALDGVYKLVMSDNKPRLKVSENIEKVLLPGRKKILRYFDNQGMFYGDAVVLLEENEIDFFHHPYQNEVRSDVKDKSCEALLHLVMKNGDIIQEFTVQEASSYLKNRLGKLPVEHLRFENPHIYKVGVSQKLFELRNSLISSVNEGSFRL